MALIKNIIQTQFTSTGSGAVNKQVETLNKNQTRLAQSSASAGRSFAAQSQGLGGLVGAYAGAAATTFALQQAFSKLAAAARAEQTLEGLKSLATASGESSSILLKNVREITKNQLTLAEAAQQINHTANIAVILNNEFLISYFISSGRLSRLDPQLSPLDPFINPGLHNATRARALPWLQVN